MRTPLIILRLIRITEIWRLFGPFDRDTWKTIFQPFRGWDVGCGYCDLEAEALKQRRCDRARRFHYRGKCGYFKPAQENTGAERR